MVAKSNRIVGCRMDGKETGRLISEWKNNLEVKKVQKMNYSVILLLAVCSGLSVANIYYAQPLLEELAEAFIIPHAVIGSIVSLTQLGCALALFLVVPLGDLIHRKKLIKIQLVSLTLVLMLIACATNQMVLFIGMVGVGLFSTAMTQGLIAYAATLSQFSERGHVVGIVQSGVVIGLLLARTFAGLVTDLSGWRSVYLISATISVLMLIYIWNFYQRQSRI